MPFAEEDALDQEMCQEAMEMYLEEVMSNIEDQKPKYLEGDFKLLNPQTLLNITIDGQEWLSAEHYIQSLRFEKGSEMYETVRTAKKAQIARRRAMNLEKSGKVAPLTEVYIRPLLEKYFNKALEFREDFKEALQNSGNSTLIYVSKADRIVGQSPSGEGKNIAGVLLQKIRSSI